MAQTQDHPECESAPWGPLKRDWKLTPSEGLFPAPLSKGAHHTVGLPQGGLDHLMCECLQGVAYGTQP